MQFTRSVNEGAILYRPEASNMSILCFFPWGKFPRRRYWCYIFGGCQHRWLHSSRCRASNQLAAAGTRNFRWRSRPHHVPLKAWKLPPPVTLCPRLSVRHVVLEISRDLHPPSPAEKPFISADRGRTNGVKHLVPRRAQWRDRPGRRDKVIAAYAERMDNCCTR